MREKSPPWEAAVANSSGAGKPQDKTKFFCHSCGGVTVHLTVQEAAAERKQGHDLEAFPLQPRTEEVARG